MNVIMPLGALLLSAAVVAQAPPDFSGTWNIDPSQSTAQGGGRGQRRGSGGGMGGGLGLGESPTRLTIRQDQTTLTIEQRGTPVSKLVYKLDGTETRNSVPAGPNRRDGRFKSTWQGAKLVTSITTSAPRGGSMTFVEERYLDANGALVVETSLPGEGRGRKVVYKRSK
jgi:hypothetical protein